MTIPLTYTLYLILCIGMTVWVAGTLRRHGRAFLIDAFGEEQVADSVNHLLVVGFYLLNIGFVTLFLSVGERPRSTDDGSGIFEYLSLKFGIVLVVLGAMHFFNVFNFAKIRRKARERREREARLGLTPSAP
jgi:hypothetical protein